MPTEIKPYCPSHDHFTDEIPVWPDSQEIIEELDGVKVVAFCDSYDTHGHAQVINEGIHQVRAFLHQNKEDKDGEELAISTSMYFHGDQWLRIISSGDILAIHLSHESIGDSRRIESSLGQLRADH